MVAVILIVGATGSGKRAFACRALGVARDDIAESVLDGRPVVAGVERLVRAAVRASGGESGVTVADAVPVTVAELVEQLAAKRIVICDEVGSGIVPLDVGERAWREAVGRACCELAAHADAVVRMVCGIPQVIKGEMPRKDGRDVASNRPRADAPARVLGPNHAAVASCTAAVAPPARFVMPAGAEEPSVTISTRSAASMDAAESSAASAVRIPLHVTLIRHGATAGNAEHRYIGAGTDEPLSPAGCAALALTARAAWAVPEAGESVAGGAFVPRCVYTSGMLRCEQTAAILFPRAERIAVPDLREMDFGAFENRSAADMTDDQAYRAWVDGGCEGRCPGGEDRAGFVSRCVAAFRQVAEAAATAGDRRVVLVVHGGTIMALLSALRDDRPDYFDIRTAPGGRHELLWDGACLRVCPDPSCSGSAHLATHPEGRRLP